MSGNLLLRLRRGRRIVADITARLFLNLTARHALVRPVLLLDAHCVFRIHRQRRGSHCQRREKDGCFHDSDSNPRNGISNCSHGPFRCVDATKVLSQTASQMAVKPSGVVDTHVRSRRFNAASRVAEFQTETPCDEHGRPRNRCNLQLQEFLWPETKSRCTTGLLLCETFPQL
jgi:hypothetical protein